MALHLVDRDLHRPRTASGPCPCRLGSPRAARLRQIAAVSYTLVVPEHHYVETWRGASTPRGCEDPPRLHRTPVRQVREGSLPRATVGRSNAPAVPASCPPRPEGSHPGPGEGNGIRTANRSRNNGARRGAPGLLSGPTPRRSTRTAPIAGRHQPVAVSRLMQPSAPSRP